MRRSKHGECPAAVAAAAALEAWAEACRSLREAKADASAKAERARALPLAPRDDDREADAALLAAASLADEAVATATAAVEAARQAYDAAAKAAHAERFRPIMPTAWPEGVEPFAILPMARASETRQHPEIGAYRVAVGVDLSGWQIRLDGEHGWCASENVQRANLLTPAEAVAAVARIGVRVDPAAGVPLARMFGLLRFEDRGGEAT